MAKKKTLADLVKEVQALLPKGCSLIIGPDRVLSLGGGVPSGEETEPEDDIDLGPEPTEEPPEEPAEEPEDEGEDEDGDDVWKEGERCQVEIDGDYYPGTVKEVNVDEEQVFIVFDDGDEGWYGIDDVEILGDEEDEGGDASTFGLEALGLAKKVHEKLEAEGYATVQEVSDALADGTLEELKSIPKAALESIKKAVKNFNAK